MPQKVQYWWCRKRTTLDASSVVPLPCHPSSSRHLQNIFVVGCGSQISVLCPCPFVCVSLERYPRPNGTFLEKQRSSSFPWRSQLSVAPSICLVKEDHMGSNQEAPHHGDPLVKGSCKESPFRGYCYHGPGRISALCDKSVFFSRSCKNVFTSSTLRRRLVCLTARIEPRSFFPLSLH